MRRCWKTLNSSSARYATWLLKIRKNARNVKKSGAAIALISGKKSNSWFVQISAKTNRIRIYIESSKRFYMVKDFIVMLRNVLWVKRRLQLTLRKFLFLQVARLACLMVWPLFIFPIANTSKVYAVWVVVNCWAMIKYCSTKSFVLIWRQPAINAMVHTIQIANKRSTIALTRSGLNLKRQKKKKDYWNFNLERIMIAYNSNALRVTKWSFIQACFILDLVHWINKIINLKINFNVLNVLENI